MSTSETRWWWVRHAPVPDGGRIYGQSDLDCDCTDAAVFAALAQELPRDAVWVTSQLGRTRQTAAAIRAAIDPQAGLAEPIVVDALAEQHLGDYQGLVRKDFFTAERRARHAFWFGPASERTPNGESFQDLVDRATAAVERLTAEHQGRDIIAVTHGGTIKAALALALRLDADAALAFVIDNCSITRIEHLGLGTVPHHWRVSAVNHRPWTRGAQPSQPHGAPVVS